MRRRGGTGAIVCAAVALVIVSFLISNGFIVRAVSGPIATGHLKAGDLPSVAALPFVVSVKSSTKE